MVLQLPARPTESTANTLTDAFEPSFAGEVEFYDNTLREGEQPPGVLFTPDEKLAIARELDQAGVHWANVGFPAVSAQELDAVRRITSAGLRMKTAALARMLPRDIDITAEAGVDLISLFLGSSDVHLQHKYRITEAEALTRIEELVPRAKSSGKLTAFCLEDGSRTPFDRIMRMFELAQDAGADYLVLADTVGVLTPTATFRIFQKLREALDVPLGVHFHDDLGLALSNTLAALQAGARMAQVTVNGVGERAGNACLEELAVLLQVKYGRDFGLKLERLDKLSDMVHQASNTAPAPHKAVTGKLCFTHESGIHVAGLLASQETYQPYPPELVGRTHEIVFGKHSGTRSVAYLAERADVALSSAGCQRVLERVKGYGKRAGEALATEQVLAWIRVEGAAEGG